MLSLIKWIVIILLLAFVWFSFSFFYHMSPNDKLEMKGQALKAIDSNDINIIAKPLAQKMGEEISHKKNTFLDKVRKKLRSIIENISIDESPKEPKEEQSVEEPISGEKDLK